MGEEIENGTIHVGEIIGKTLDGKDIYKFTELGIAENVKIIAPQYKDGNFVVNMNGSVLIFKNKVGDKVYSHAYLTDCLFLIISAPSKAPIERCATEAEKQKLLDALAKAGKRWNAERLCVEDIPKFRVGDKVRIKAGVSSKTHGYTSPIFVTSMDELIGKELTVEGYGNLFVRCYGYYFSEEWLEPYEELKEGDFAIFWDENKEYAKIGIYLHRGVYHYDHSNTSWTHAIKFESKEQYEKLINGEL